MHSVDVTPHFETLKDKKSSHFTVKTASRQTGGPSIFDISMFPSTQGIMIIVEDKTLEEETKRLLTIGQTAGMVGHDIRNPLQSMMNDVYLLKDELTAMLECKTKEGVSESLNNIEKNIAYINKIVADLQDYARPLKLEVAEINIEILITNALASANFPGNVEVLACFDEKIPKVKIDPILLKRVVLNLITNAIQAMPEGGKLTIQTNLNTEPEKFAITIQDTGVGIPKDVQDKLFTPLFTTKSKGQGFGLAVVKRLVEAQGGTISFESQEGMGTKFTVKLPIQSKPPSAYTIEQEKIDS